ncbi:DddA-like double-stranded DNA deaminase toxin [Lentzea albidocapillata]|uniref:DddA-like double-stranded DNA deaminase toxin n=1 Tax=Lentzea albidocapillata TaxID=40571 RepID=UPI000B7DBF6D|nr:DddA-like double-stranded DNA deaminase toxin [Lentzea albidocapillata]
MTTFADVAAVLDQVVRKVEDSIASLMQASVLAGECRSHFAETMCGTAEEAEADAAVASFDAVSDGAQALISEAKTALEGVARVRASFESVGKPGHTAPAPSTAEPMSPGEQPWVMRSRAQLPAYQTSGMYQDPDGHSDVVQSGREPDGEHDRINDHLVRLGIGRPGASLEASKHVEVKVGWRMRLTGVSHAELVVNNELCNGALSCAQLLPFVLGPGQTLTVHDPVRSRVFRGKDVR